MEEVKEMQDQLDALLKIVKSQAATQKAQAESLKLFQEWITSQGSSGSQGQQPPRKSEEFSTEFLMETISNSISSEFIYDPDSDATFEKWYSKYKDLFKDDAKKLDEKTRLRILLRKLDRVSTVFIVISFVRRIRKTFPSTTQ